MTHRATLTTDHYANASWSFTCDAPVGAPCRLTCVEECEEIDEQNHDHELKDSGECQYVCWIENDDAANECITKEFVAWRGEVKIEWENDHYEFTPLPASSLEGENG